MTPLRVAVVLDSLSRANGGLFEAERRLQQSLLVNDGVAVEVFGLEDTCTASDLGSWAPVKVRTFPPKGLDAFGYSAGLKQAVRDYSPDLLYRAGLWKYPSLMSLGLAKSSGKPLVIAPHGMLDPWALRNSSWKKCLALAIYERQHLEKAACLRALCSAEARAMRARGLKNPIAIIPNGIDVPEMRPQDNQITSSQNASPWLLPEGLHPDGRKVLLYLGRIHPKKGLANLLKAWAACHQSPAAPHSEWLLAIAGWDQCGHETELKLLATELEIAWTDVREHPKSNQRSAVDGRWSVVFLGPQFEGAKAACYEHCDAFVLPSFSEGLPMTVLEAWSYGKPVMMTPECNLPCGFTREAAMRIETTPDDIARGLRELFQLSDSGRASRGENGLRLVREQFAWPGIGHELRRIYEWLLGGGNTPDCVILN